jgi:hypothetical protein
LTLSRVGLVRAVGNDARAELELETSGGVCARIAVDRVAAARRRTVRVLTNDAVFLGDLLAPRLAMSSLDGSRLEEVPLAPEEPLAAQAAALAAALAEEDASAHDDGETSIATGLDGARALAIAERAAYVLARPRLRDTEPLAAEKL